MSQESQPLSQREEWLLACASSASVALSIAVQLLRETTEQGVTILLDRFGASLSDDERHRMLALVDEGDIDAMVLSRRNLFNWISEGADPTSPWISRF